MLQSLIIKNFALIEHLQVNWTRGLNVLTGETGAGKSILFDAVSVLLGAKAGPALIRSGAEKAQIEGTFKVSPKTCVWLKEQELLDNDSDELVMAREINKSGSRFRINGTLVNQAITQQLRPFLISLYAQLEAVTLLSSQAQLEMLDALGDKKHAALLDNIASLYARKKDLDDQLKSLQLSEEERLRRLDFSHFQLAELAEAQLDNINEDVELAEQASILSNVVALGTYAMNAEQFLLGDKGDSSNAETSPPAIDALQAALSEIERAQKFDNRLEPVGNLLASGLANLEEAATKLRKYYESLETDPEQLQEMESRIAQLATIKRKHGPTLAEAIERRQTLEIEVNNLENAQVRSDELSVERQGLIEQLSILAQDLTQRRQALAKQLAKRIETDLVDLGMERCRFEINVTSLPDIGTAGGDKVEFMISANPGQPPASLAKIASGGELSRIMLVIKSIFAQADQVATVVFDEIDTGLSGRVLQSMRDKLAYLAKSHQILCITHQPLIAAIADNHLQILKQQTDKTTTVSMKVLTDRDRLKALAEMASGQEDQEIAISFAESLINQADQVRSN